ncbi:hypothetical protein PVAG01_03592 [Phlyctema vagabunda]|uniref:Transposase n=1 Tax=Phlyctema vagabunda TaxID=108571 RepID=A0ABR4PMZ9_9HELO
MFDPGQFVIRKCLYHIIWFALKGLIQLLQVLDLKQTHLGKAMQWHVKDLCAFAEKTCTSCIGNATQVKNFFVL